MISYELTYCSVRSLLSCVFSILSVDFHVDSINYIKEILNDGDFFVLGPNILEKGEKNIRKGSCGERKDRRTPTVRLFPLLTLLFLPLPLSTSTSSSTCIRVWPRWGGGKREREKEGRMSRGGKEGGRTSRYKGSHLET